jgi:hypothetical protein
VAPFRSRVGRAAKLLTVDLRGKQGTSRREGWNLARDLAVGTNAGGARVCQVRGRRRSREGRRADQRHQKEEEMTGTLDWKWIGVGVVVMVVLNLIAGLILGLFLLRSLKASPAPRMSR